MGMPKGSLAFDIETGPADELFTYQGDFCRLAGYGERGNDPVTTTDMNELVEKLNQAQYIYGHNIMGFDLLALAHQAWCRLGKAGRKGYGFYDSRSVGLPAAEHGIPGEARTNTTLTHLVKGAE